MGQLWELWSAWWSGKQVGSLQLWGYSVLAWGRLGKLLQFVAGLTVVLDLIGSEPLRSFGQRLVRIRWARGLRSTAERVAVVVFVVSLIAYIVLLVAVFAADFIPAVADLFPEPDPESEQQQNLSWSDYLIVVGVVVTWFAIAFVTHTFYYGDSAGKSKSEIKSELYGAFFLAPVVVAAAIVAAIILLPWLLFIYGLCVPVSRGSAWLLDRARPAHPLRWAAVLFFVAGFHFDLLAS